MSVLNSDLVRDSRLNTTCVGEVTRHVVHVSDPTARRRALRVEESWTRKKLLGSGSYGTVWLETCTEGRKRGELRAVKEILKPDADAKSKPIDYGRELEAIAKFSNEKYVHCFVRSHGWFETSRAVYIAMEYLRLGDLQNYIIAPFPEPEVQDMISQLAEGLHFMHENGFTHRDLKPRNILVFRDRPDWWLKIGDFGITKRVEAEATALRTQIGTLGYVAPEVQGIFTLTDSAITESDQSKYFSAVDIWSLGEIAFRLLTNEATFPNPLLLFNYVTVGQAFPAGRLAERAASVDCQNFIKTAMAPSPAKRPTAKEPLSSPWIKTLTGHAAPFDDKETIDNMV